ncbi:phospholipase D-like domain-containing protein [Sphingomonas sp. UYP23]
MKHKPPPASTVLFDNEGDEDDHASRIIASLANATHFICIVAFAKTSGLKLIREALEARAAKGIRATFVVGIDFFQSEPGVLRVLLQMQRAAGKAGNVKVYMGKEAGGATLHPKIYWSKKPNTETLIVGSANMTSGGFCNNHEISATLADGVPSSEKWLRAWISRRVKTKDVVEASPALIDRYEQRRDIYRAAMKAAERRARRAMQAPPGQIVSLSDLLAEMRADDGPDGFDAQSEGRRLNHAKAQSLLAGLARDPDLKRSMFLTRYEEQIGCWHSGGLQRGKTAIARKGARFQEALRALDSEPSQDPAKLFDLLRHHFDGIPRAGINVLTEVLHTRDPRRFPVMNRNSVAGMGLANITGYPRAPAKSSVDGARYARFAADAEGLRRGLGLGDLSELDVLFNFAYWKEPEATEED